MLVACPRSDGSASAASLTPAPIVAPRRSVPPGLGVARALASAGVRTPASSGTLPTAPGLRGNDPTTPSNTLNRAPTTTIPRRTQPRTRPAPRPAEGCAGTPSSLCLPGSTPVGPAAVPRFPEGDVAERSGLEPARGRGPASGTEGPPTEPVSGCAPSASKLQSAAFALKRIIRRDQGKKAFSGLELVC